MRAMTWWCWVVILFGLVLIGGGFAATDVVAVQLLERFGGAGVTMTPALRFFGGADGGGVARLGRVAARGRADDGRYRP